MVENNIVVVVTLDKVCSAKIYKSNKQKPVAVEKQRNLSFDEHNSTLFEKIGRKFSVPARLSNCTRIK